MAIIGGLSGGGIIGISEMNARLLNLIRALPDEIENALIKEAGLILEEAKNLCPVDTGALRDSGEVRGMDRVGFETMIPITFGDPVPYYAIFVHEDLDARHPNGGEAKFLEKAVMRAEPGMSVRVGRSIQIERLVK
jgi:hypothetical protein